MKAPTMIRNRIAQMLALSATCAIAGTMAVNAAEDPGIVRDTGVSKMDKTFAIEATHGLMRDGALAIAAEHRATSPEVRKFAQKLQDQRTRAHDRLQQLAKKTRLRLPERLDAYQRDQVQKLSALSGRAFDKQFLQYIAETDHVRFYQFELNNGALRVYPPVRKFAEEQLPILRRDMARARELLQDYR